MHEFTFNEYYYDNTTTYYYNVFMAAIRRSVVNTTLAPGVVKRGTC